MLAASLSRSGGGIFDASRRMAQELHRLDNTTVHAVGLLDEHTTADAAAWAPIPTVPCPTVGPPRLGWAPGMRRVLDQLEPDIVHQHGIWRLPSYTATRWAQRTRRPLIIQLHGTLDTWALRNSAWKKRLALLLYERAHLDVAFCLLALCEAEAIQLREFGLTNPIALVPNGVDIPIDTGAPAPWRDSLGDDRRVILFLGRIHPKKGIEHLLRAWSGLAHRDNVRADNWSLVVTGWDDGGHQAYIHQLAKELGLSSPELHFTGALFAEDKKAAFSNASAFVLPSFSEGLPMTVLEALAHRLPTAMTEACNLPEAFSAKAAIQISPSPESIRSGLERIMALRPAEAREMGERGLALVNTNFTWERVAHRMRQVYSWGCGGSRPDFVI